MKKKKDPTQRQTVQRLKIVEYLKSVRTHPNAETVYKEVLKELPALSLGTVYRNLNLLAKEGEILKLDVGNEAHFDGTTCNHEHCICNKCGKIIDLEQKEISEFALKKARTEEFQPECVCIIYKGYCKKCNSSIS